MAQFLIWTTPAAERIMVYARFSGGRSGQFWQGEGQGVENWKNAKLLTNCNVPVGDGPR